MLIPRPETEVLVGLVHQHVSTARSMLEVGCGSGALSLALLHIMSELTVTAIDISEHAIELTRRNTQRLQLHDRITSHHCSLETFQPERLFDIIVSNPPYITTAEMKLLDPEIYMYAYQHDQNNNWIVMPLY